MVVRRQVGKMLRKPGCVGGARSVGRKRWCPMVYCFQSVEIDCDQFVL